MSTKVGDLSTADPIQQQMYPVSANGIHHSMRNHSKLRLRYRESWYQFHLPARAGKPPEKYVECLGCVHVDVVIANNQAWRVQYFSKFLHSLSVIMSRLKRSWLQYRIKGFLGELNVI